MFKRKRNKSMTKSQSSYVFQQEKEPEKEVVVREAHKFSSAQVCFFLSLFISLFFAVILLKSIDKIFNNIFQFQTLK